MCGIIGITRNSDTNSAKIGKMIYDALARLEYRGYDSVGLAVNNGTGIRVLKDKGKIGEVGKDLHFENITGSTAIGHSRWATHGPPSKENAHPHKSKTSDIAVIHNGIIENYLSIKADLVDLGYEFISQTDTELIPHFLSHQINEKNMSMEEAIIELDATIKGTYALVITHIREPNRIYALRKDNPLVLGISEGINFCASDIPAFLPYTNEVIILKDRELAILEPESYQIKKLPDLNEVQRKPHTVTWTAEAAQKGGYPHYMLKEIHEQSKVLSTQLATQNDVFEKIAGMVYDAEKIFLVAAGTAHYASLNAYHTFPKYGGKVTIPVVAAEWDSASGIVDENSLILAVSQSGETLDTMKAIKDARSLGAKVASVVNVTGSSLTTISDRVGYIHAGPEIGVAATKTYVAQSFAVSRIAYELAKMSGRLDGNEIQEFANVIENIPRVVQKVVQNSESKARDLAKWFATKNSAFYLGRGISHVTALEGALKMKEISYIHAEAYPAGESKHGPIALVEKDYPVVFTVPNDSNRDKMIGSIQEMAARGATTVGIIEAGDKEIASILDHSFEIPQGYSNYLTPISYIIPQQILAYYTSVNRDASPDMPRNLAKSVTVE